jgi:hypothetical protein
MADTNTQISVLMKQAKENLKKMDTGNNKTDAIVVPDTNSSDLAVSNNIVVNFDSVIYNSIFQKFNRNNS